MSLFFKVEHTRSVITSDLALFMPTAPVTEPLHQLFKVLYRLDDHSGLLRGAEKIAELDVLSIFAQLEKPDGPHYP